MHPINDQHVCFSIIGPSILQLCQIENERVNCTLIFAPNLALKNYLVNKLVFKKYFISLWYLNNKFCYC